MAQKPYAQTTGHFDGLYRILDLYCNFGDVMKPDCQKWHDWTTQLHSYHNILPEIIKAISDSQLDDIMGRRTKPNVGDIKKLAKQIIKNKALDASTAKLLTSNQAVKEINADHVHNMLEAARTDPRGKSGSREFMQTQAFRDDPRRAIDIEISRRTGTEPKL